MVKLQFWGSICFCIVAIPYLSMTVLHQCKLLPEAYEPLYGKLYIIFFSLLLANLVRFIPYLLFSVELLFGLTLLDDSILSTPAKWFLLFSSWFLISIFCFWRTWVHSSESFRRREDKPSGKAAAWWGYVLGILAAMGIYGVMAYYFYYQS
jgi:hypothetical protein